MVKTYCFVNNKLQFNSEKRLSNFKKIYLMDLLEKTILGSKKTFKTESSKQKIQKIASNIFEDNFLITTNSKDRVPMLVIEYFLRCFLSNTTIQFQNAVFRALCKILNVHGAKRTQFSSDHPCWKNNVLGKETFYIECTLNKETRKKGKRVTGFKFLQFISKK